MKKIRMVIPSSISSDNEPISNPNAIDELLVSELAAINSLLYTIDKLLSRIVHGISICTIHATLHRDIDSLLSNSVPQVCFEWLCCVVNQYRIGYVC